MANPHLPAPQRELAKTLLGKALDDAKLTDEQKEYVWHVAQGGTETFTEWKKDLKKAGATSVTVNSGEKSYDQGMGKAYSDQFIEFQKGGRSADTEIGTLRILDALTHRPDFYSGAGGNLVLRANKALVALGVKDAKAASPSEVFEALSNQTILDAAGGSLGNQISNADREFIQRTTATLSNTPEGNRELIGIRRKLAERKKEVAGLAREYARAHNGRIDSGFDDELARWTEANPLFGDAAQTQPGAPQPARGGNPAAIKQKYGLE